MFKQRVFKYQIPYYTLCENVKDIVSAVAKNTAIQEAGCVENTRNRIQCRHLLKNIKTKYPKRSKESQGHTHLIRDQNILNFSRSGGQITQRKGRKHDREDYDLYRARSTWKNYLFCYLEKIIQIGEMENLKRNTEGFIKSSKIKLESETALNANYVANLNRNWVTRYPSITPILTKKTMPKTISLPYVNIVIQSLISGEKNG